MPAWLRLEGDTILHPMPRARNFCIGRNPDCDLRISDPKASRNHAIVQNSDHNNYYLIDIASRNGCYINGKRINAPVLLKQGDKIRIGDTYFDFLLDNTPEKKLDPNETIISQIDINAFDIQEITILVADIRGFTTITESLPITSLSMIMNQWFMEVADCVAENYGILDKFIGDCVYARWNNQPNTAGPVLHALRTACGLNQIAAKITAQFPEIPFPLQMGVGINTGHAALDIGLDNTAMGDAVNLAFRLEDQTKSVGKNVVISEESYKLLPDVNWSHGQRQVKVKGKKDKVAIVAIDFPDVEKYLSTYTEHKAAIP